MTGSDNQAEIRAWIRAAMAKSGMTQADLCKRIWPSDRTVLGKILLGKRRAQIGEVDAIARETGFAPLNSGPEGPSQKSMPPLLRQRKFLQTTGFKFYVKDWRKFMVGEKLDDVSRSVGLDVDEYQAFETYPINFTLGQIVALAEEIGIRGEQFWFPPPRRKTNRSLQPASAARRAKR